MVGVVIKHIINMKSFTKTRTQTYTTTFVYFPFKNYDTSFKTIRDGMKYKANKCFKCERSFELNEQIGLACFSEVGNKVLCKNCSEELK